MFSSLLFNLMYIPDSVIHELLSFDDQLFEMGSASKALRVNLINVLCTGRSSGEPSARRHHLKTSNGCAVSGGVCEDILYSFSSEFL